MIYPIAFMSYGKLLPSMLTMRRESPVHKPGFCGSGQRKRTTKQRALKSFSTEQCYTALVERVNFRIRNHHLITKILLTLTHLASSHITCVDCKMCYLIGFRALTEIV